MDLIEEMEREAALATSSATAVASTNDAHDAVLQQAAFVQAQLQALWAAQQQQQQLHAAKQPVVVPFAWVLARVRSLINAHGCPQCTFVAPQHVVLVEVALYALTVFNMAALQLLRLTEEYPDGVTEAIVVTELVAHLQRKVFSGSGNQQRTDRTTSSSSRKVRGVEDLALVLTELEEEEGDAIPARLLGFDGHKLSLLVDKSSNLELTMCEAQRSTYYSVSRANERSDASNATVVCANG